MINVPLHPRVLLVQPFSSALLSFTSHCIAGLQNLIVVSSALLNKLIFLQPNPLEMLSISEKHVTHRSGRQRAAVFRLFTGNTLNHFLLKARFIYLQSYQINPRFLSTLPSTTNCKQNRLMLRIGLYNTSKKCKAKKVFPHNFEHGTWIQPIDLSYHKWL